MSYCPPPGRLHPPDLVAGCHRGAGCRGCCGCEWLCVVVVLVVSFVVVVFVVVVVVVDVCGGCIRGVANCCGVVV
jgi:hypothetical protein